MSTGNYPAETKMFGACILVLLGIFLAGCNHYPQDPQHSLQNILERKVLRVGVIEHAPWAYQNTDTLTGVEVQIVSDFADTLNAKPEWTVLPESRAMKQLAQYQLDIVIGGLTTDNPRKQEVGFTRPYLITGGDTQGEHVLAVPHGENYLLSTLEKFLAGHRREIQYYYTMELNHEAGPAI